MKKKIFATVVALTLVLSPMTAHAYTNKDIVNKYIEESFMAETDYQVKFIKSEKLTWKKLIRRKALGIIYVEKIISISRGEYGVTNTGRIVWYNKKTKPGKTVKSFYVHNPTSNELNDIIAVVDHKRIR